MPKRKKLAAGLKSATKNCILMQQKKILASLIDLDTKFLNTPTHLSVNMR